LTGVKEKLMYSLRDEARREGYEMMGLRESEFRLEE